MISYRVRLDVPVSLVWFVSGLLAARRREIGTRKNTRILGCYRQAVFGLADPGRRALFKRELLALIASLKPSFLYMPALRRPLECDIPTVWWSDHDLLSRTGTRAIWDLVGLFYGGAGMLQQRYAWSAGARR